jgi:hypothetical protein
VDPVWVGRLLSLQTLVLIDVRGIALLLESLVLSETVGLAFWAHHLLEPLNLMLADI